MYEMQARTAPIPYAHYRAEAARLRRQAIDEAFARLRRLLQRRRQGDRGYGGLSGAGCGQ